MSISLRAGVTRRRSFLRSRSPFAAGRRVERRAVTGVVALRAREDAVAVEEGADEHEAVAAGVLDNRNGEVVLDSVVNSGARGVDVSMCGAREDIDLVQDERSVGRDVLERGGQELERAVQQTGAGVPPDLDLPRGAG